MLTKSCVINSYTWSERINVSFLIACIKRMESIKLIYLNFHRWELLWEYQLPPIKRTHRDLRGAIPAMAHHYKKFERGIRDAIKECWFALNGVTSDPWWSLALERRSPIINPSGLMIWDLWTLWCATCEILILLTTQDIDGRKVTLQRKCIPLRPLRDLLMTLVKVKFLKNLNNNVNKIMI